jgi:hypothetical protein
VTLYVAAQDVTYSTAQEVTYLLLRKWHVAAQEVTYFAAQEVILCVAAQEVTCCGARSDIICCCSRSDIIYCCSRSDMLLLKKWYMLRRKKWQVATQGVRIYVQFQISPPRCFRFDKLYLRTDLCRI